MEWFFDLNDKENYMAFSFTGHNYHVYYNSDDDVNDPQLVTKIAFSQIINKVTDEHKGATQSLVSKLEKRIPHNMR
jgi:hypothetical protein